MKYGVFSALLMALTMSFTSTVHAATVWYPTDGDINASAVHSTTATTFGFFENDNPGLVGGALLTFEGGDIITVSGTTLTNTRTSASTTLSGSPAFILAANIGGVWIADTSVFQDSPTVYLVGFMDRNGREASLSTT